MIYDIIISGMCSLYLYADKFEYSVDKDTLDFFKYSDYAQLKKIAHFNLSSIVGFYETQEDIFKRMLEDKQKAEIEVYEDEKKNEEFE